MPRETIPYWHKPYVVLDLHGADSVPKYVARRLERLKGVRVERRGEYLECKGWHLLHVYGKTEAQLESWLSALLLPGGLSWEYATAACSEYQDAREAAIRFSIRCACVQHVYKLPDGHFGVSDWRDDATICSFENGRELPC